MSARLARLRPHLPLAVLVLAGLALRVLLMVEYRPAALSNADSARFLHFAHYPGGLFEDHFGPSGYAALLKAIRFFTTRFEATIALQHLMGHSQIHTTMLYVQLAPQDVWREYARAVASRAPLTSPTVP